MQALDIMQEIQQLPLDKKFRVVEETLKAIKVEESTNLMALAADKLHGDYKTDNELIGFTALDLEHFYEAK